MLLKFKIAKPLLEIFADQKKQIAYRLELKFSDKPR